MIWRYALLAILFLALVYPVSAGPYVWLDANGSISNSVSDWFRPVYKPLILGNERFPSLFRYYDGYLAAWLGGDVELEAYRFEFAYPGYVWVF